MSYTHFKLEHEQKICTACFLPVCLELTRGPKADCPLRISRRLNLTANQGRQLSQIAEARQYRPEHFLRMAEIQAERNQL